MHELAVNNLSLFFFLGLCITTIIYFILPQRWKLDGVAVCTGLFLWTISPLSLTWILISTLMTWYASKIKTSQTKYILIITSILCLVFLLYQFVENDSHLVSQSIILIGIGYYTCRNIHVLIELYKGTISSLSLRQYLHYQLFLPVILNGPIHRYHHFVRQCQRCHYSWDNTFDSAERILYGSFKVIFIGSYLLSAKFKYLLNNYEISGFFLQFLLSMDDWLILYAVFSGYMDIALGFAKIWGFSLEENFNSPFLARNLIDFWQRWHISLSSWCKDYIYTPVIAHSRNGILAAFLAMMAIALWHNVSLYYFLWGLYQALGIMLFRAYQKINFVPLQKLPNFINRFIAQVTTFTWLVSAKPIIQILLLKLKHI